MDTRLTAVFGFHFLHAHAVGLDATVTAARTNAFIDEHAGRRVRALAAAAQAPQFRRAFLILQHHGRTGRPASAAWASSTRSRPQTSESAGRLTFS